MDAPPPSEPGTYPTSICLIGHLIQSHYFYSRGPFLLQCPHDVNPTTFMQIISLDMVQSPTCYLTNPSHKYSFSYPAGINYNLSQPVLSSADLNCPQRTPSFWEFQNGFCPNGQAKLCGNLLLWVYRELTIPILWSACS